jgi:excisionase family DNA binding protein
MEMTTKSVRAEEASESPTTTLIVPGMETATMEQNGKLLTADDVAEMLTMTPGWVYEQSRLGRIPTVRLGRYRRYCADAIEQWIEKQHS